MVRNAIISLDARVYDNTLIESTFVASQAVVVGCQSVSIVSFDDNCTNCSGSMQITVGAESGGGRELNLQAESTMIDVCEQLLKDHPSSTLATSHKPSKQQLQVPVPMMNIVCSQAIVCGTLIINNVFVYPHASIEAATSVEQTILFPYATIRTASVVKQTILQWSVSISGSSNVSNTMLMEHAHVGPSSILASSVLGPDVHVSAGEIHASIIGPNTNSHHQSLIIGILWPLGRGNVGYGANLGSNHTGRLPDQETVAGEGTFWGLSTVIKFPVDLSNAPYSIVAAGTQLSPQRVRMPFSLIVTNERNGGNSILPGWVLRSSPYTLARSEKKFATRRKAVHHDSYTGWRILRPDVIELCLWARQSLQTVVEHKPIYRNDKDIVGIGTAQLTEKGRIDGMQAYDDCIKRFALQGLVTWLEQHVNGNKIQPGSGCLDTSLDMELVSSPMTIPDLNAVEWSRFPWQSNKSELWNFQKALLLHEFPNSTSSWIAWLIPLLRLYIKLETNYAENIYNCKQRDDVRGAKVIPGYVAAHVVAEDDPVIQEARATADENGKTALLLLDRFTGNASIPLDSKL
jgi:carbonic anhydrase/acetyltransferase-like protein (isoleucine patch superfamily)